MVNQLLSRGLAIALLGISSLSWGAELVTNGGFETHGAPGSTSFTGWTFYGPPGGQGGFYPQTGTQGPLTPFTVPAPPAGSAAAMSDQVGPGAAVLYQDVAIPAGTTATLTARLFVLNQATDFSDAGSLDYTQVPNQQARFDVMNPAAPVLDVGAGVLRNVFVTLPGSTPAAGYVTVVVDMSAYAGQTVRLRLAEVDNQQGLLFGADGVSIQVPGTTPTTTVLASSANPVAAGGSTVFTATVTGGTPTGYVAFTWDGGALAGCEAVAVTAGTATCPAGSLLAGTHTVVARYLGDAILAASNGTLTQYVQGPPGAPGNVVATASNGAAIVSFSPPSNDGGSPITSYQVSCTPSGGGTAVTASGGSSPILVSGLSNGVAYQCTVTAINGANGPGTPAPAVAPVTPSALAPAALGVPVLSPGGVLLMGLLLALFAPCFHRPVRPDSGRDGC